MDAAERQPHTRVDVRGLALGAVAGSLASLLQPVLVPVSPSWLLALLPVPWLRPLWRAGWIAFLCGAAWAGWHAERALDDRWPPHRHGETHWVMAAVDGFPERDGNALRLLLRSAGDAYPQRIRAAWYDVSDRANHITPGSCWHWQLRLRTPTGSANPGGFDYEGWLFRERIGATASIRDARPCGGSANGSIDGMRHRLAQRVRAVAGDGRAAGVLRALLIGDRSGIDNAQWNAFRRSGTSHLMAISGLHVGILAGMAWWLVIVAWRALPALAQRIAAPRAALVVSVSVALGYSAMAGFELPTLRALCMLSAVALAIVSGRRPAASAVLSLAALAALLVDPFAPLRPGFWLSFCAVAVIVLVLSGHRVGWFAGLLRVQLALSLALAPLSALFFSGISLSGLLVNLVAVPLMSVLLPVLMLGTGAALLGGTVLPLTIGLALLDGCLRLLDPITDLPMAWAAFNPSAWQAAILALGASSLLLWRLRLWPLGLLCIAAVMVPPARPAQGDVRIAFLDVGQGTSVVVETRRHRLLYDAGPAWGSGFDAGRLMVEPYLQRRRFARIDRAIVSHGDRDHAGGMNYLRDAGWLDSRVPPAIGCRAGERWSRDEVRFETLHPPPSGFVGNNASCVLRIAGDGWAVLLPGDIEADAERALVAAGADLRADVLLAPHHGSRTSSSDAFIRAVDPQLVIHSAGWKHRFGHPHQTVMSRYRNHGVMQLSTADDGAVSVVWRGPELIIERARHQRRLWRR